MPTKPSKVTTSLVVDFGQTGDAKGVLKAEIDDRPTGLNGGETSFTPGQTVGYMVAKSSNVAINAHIASYGSPVAAGSYSFTHEEIVIFTGENTTSPEYPILSGFTYAWLGKNPGALTATESEITLSKAAGEQYSVGVAKISYSTTVDLYTLASPTSLGGVQEFSIVVFLSGTAS